MPGVGDRPNMYLESLVLLDLAEWANSVRALARVGVHVHCFPSKLRNELPPSSSTIRVFVRR
jgi:hypothetical protein